MRIGLFDSGIGGLTVLKEILHKLPHDHFIYFGDTARFPYGDKSSATIISYSIQNSLFLLEKGVDLIVVACNTASAHALGALKQALSVPVIGVIDAAVQEAVRKSTEKRIGIIGTRGTIDSQVYQKRIQEAVPAAEITAVACPLLAPLVEENFQNTDITKQLIHHYMMPLKNASIDTLILACTHYSLLKDALRDTFPESVLIDPAQTIAQEIVAWRSLHPKESQGAPSCQFFVSDNPERFSELSTIFLGPLEDNAIAKSVYNDKKIFHIGSGFSRTS